MGKSLKLLICAVIVCILGYLVYFLNSALPIGTGYSAKYVCSQVFLANRNPATVFKNEVLPTHPLFRLVSPRVDYENRTVTSKALGFWKPMTAVYREGCGCTLAVDTSRDQLLDQAKNILAPEFSRPLLP
ncbi:MAG: hypothetical protein HUK40_18085 [Desulfobacter sp.]|nr:hypothetical protein [Desulfobacter sp.]WDP85857.1 MAG: hypothetical protein HUN05_12520 [Desulfobacter sp.]